MAFPIWQTTSGSLGTLAENTTVRLELEATGTGITYSLVSGSLPRGLVLLETGVIVGVVSEVSEITDYSFTIRATNADNKITDRGFIITVTGPDTPDFVVDPGLLFSCASGDVINYEILASDLDPNTTLTYTITAGELPQGLRLTVDGRIVGIAGAACEQTGDDYTKWNYTGPVEQRGTYESTFTLRVSDGVNTSTSNYFIRVEDRRGYTCDSIEITCDTIASTTDAYPDLAPIFLTRPEVGILRHANYWLYPLKVYDPNGDKTIYYEIIDSTQGGYDNTLGFYDSSGYGYDLGGNVTLPEINIDNHNGVLKGTLPTIIATSVDHEILVRASFTSDDGLYISSQRSYYVTVRGDLERAITWVSGTNLGTVVVGDPSELRIEAVLGSGTRDLYYKIVDNKLPPGLLLTSNGLIIGTTSKRITEVDSNTTTWDGGSTTIDKTYTFTVQAYNADTTIIDTKTFSITVEQRTRGLFYDFWVKGLVPESERKIWSDLVFDQYYFPRSALYRPDDPNFGVNQEFRTLIAKGVKSVDPEQLVLALNLNHGKKTYYFGEFKYAESRDPITNDLAYEVVYVELVDPLENANGSPDPDQVIVRDYGGTEPITADTTVYTADSDLLRTDFANVELVHPNSTTNMRYRLDQYLDTIQTGFLPNWMRSLQETSADRLGYTKALVLAYVQPGEAKRVLKRINNDSVDLSDIHYEVDRYYVEPIYKYEQATYFDERITTWDDLSIDSEVTDNKFFVFNKDLVT